jgi:hypothetical protein
MASSYPGGLDSFTNPTSTDGMNSPSHSDQHADANDAIEAIQAELGTNPSGSFTTVKDRLDDIAGGGGGGGGGLVLIDSGTFTTVSSKSIDGCFDSTYDDYLIILFLQGSAASDILVRMRASSSDASGSNYNNSNYSINWPGNNSSPLEGNDAQSSWSLRRVNTTKRTHKRFTLYAPAEAHQTGLDFTGTDTHAYANMGVGYHDVATAYDGFTFYPSSGTITGRYAVYGYAK